MSYRILTRQLTQGVPPADAYWARPGLTRAELDALVASRKHQQAPATLRDVRFEPAHSATISLLMHKVRVRMRKGALA